MPVTATLRKATPASVPAGAPTTAPAKQAAPKPSLAQTLRRTDVQPTPTPEGDVEVESTTTYVEPGTDSAAGASAMARIGNSAPAPRGAYSDASGGGVEGDFDTDDIKLPQLKLVNGSGPLSKTFNQGSTIFADLLLWEPPRLQAGASNPVMRFVPLKIVKQFRENLTQDEIDQETMPRIVNSRAEAERIGGTTQWIGGQKPRWSPSAKCIFLLEEPEGTDHPGFTISIDGKNYALAVFYASGMGYGESAKVIFNAAQTTLKDPRTGRISLHKRFWTFKVGRKQSGLFNVWVPAVQVTKEETGPQIAELAAQINGVNVEAAE